MKAKEFINLIDPEIAQVKFNVIRRKIGVESLRRKNIEKTHILIITLPTRKISREEYIDLIDYIDVGGTLFLTLPSPPWNELGRWFSEFIEELGINFQKESVYGIPKIPLNTRLIGTKLMSHRAHVINYNSNHSFMKENGIAEYIPIALIDEKPIILAARKRRGRFIIFSSIDTMSPNNKCFLNILLRLSSQRKSFLLDETTKRKIGNTTFFFSLQHATLRTFLLSLYHHDFRFYQEIVEFTKMEELADKIFKIMKKQEVLSTPPTLDEIKSVLKEEELEMD